MLAKDLNNDNTQSWSKSIIGLNIRNEYLPFVLGIAAFSSLIVLILVVYFIYKCCSAPEKLKTRDVVNPDNMGGRNLSNSQSFSTIFMDQGRLPETTHVVELIPEHDGPISWLYRDHMFGNVSYDGESYESHVNNKENIARPPRPRSHPAVPLSVTSLEDYSLPQISEFCAHPCQYASNNILDDCYTPGYGVSSFRTRSLPSCAKFKKHHLSTMDSSNDLYDKVNFSKKRKNRMRNDEAAIIALSKSRSQFFNKDTDTLVDNEAVIVYDERTAL